MLIADVYFGSAGTSSWLSWLTALGPSIAILLGLLGIWRTHVLAVRRELAARVHEHNHQLIVGRISCLTRAITQVHAVETLLTTILATENLLAKIPDEQTEQRLRWRDFRLAADTRFDDACNALVCAVEEYGNVPPEAGIEGRHLGPHAHAWLQEIYSVLWKRSSSLDAVIAAQKVLVKLLRNLKSLEEERLGALDTGKTVSFRSITA